MSESIYDGYRDGPYGGNNIKSIKKRVKSIATELAYPHKVIMDIENAKTEEEISRIMISARKGEYDKWR